MNEKQRALYNSIIKVGTWDGYVLFKSSLNECSAIVNKNNHIDDRWNIAAKSGHIHTFGGDVWRAVVWEDRKWMVKPLVLRAFPDFTAEDMGFEDVPS